ncbi:MAG: hypothetical protein NTZ72_19580 [Afipia sp.]|nr:hypothetical protein [Afipia sp.]
MDPVLKYPLIIVGFLALIFIPMIGFSYVLTEHPFIFVAIVGVVGFFLYRRFTKVRFK